MIFKTSIAAKIFGLVIILLLLTIALASFLLWQASRIEAEMRLISTVNLPLAESISKINEAGLRRRLAFERWFGALNATQPNSEVVAEASRNYLVFTGKLNEEFVSVKRLLEAPTPSGSESTSLAEIRILLNQIESAYPAMSARQQQVLDLQRSGENVRANELLNVLNDTQRSVLEGRELMRSKVAAMTDASARRISQQQRFILWLSIAATASTVLLGLVVAAVITLRLTQPVRSLMTALQAVRGGNLELRLPVQSNDELGTLTDSFNFFVQELRTKEQIKRTFGKYIDPRILEQVLRNPGDTNIVGERCVMTVLFADLVGFTNLSERLTPSLLVQLLNRHFGLQALAVQEYRGVVDKFIGDAIMAFWGPPFVPKEEHAVLACRAALAQLAALYALRKELSDLTGLRKDAPEIDLRIGICTGDVVVGNIGSDNTRSYTVIGDTVNLASRIEGANRIFGTSILLSQATADQLDDAFELREIDAIAVKGKTEAVRLYELLGASGDVPQERLRLRDCYTQALAAYRSGLWDDAEMGFRSCIGVDPKDRASSLMLTRVAALRTSANTGGLWDGVWHLEEK